MAKRHFPGLLKGPVYLELAVESAKGRRFSLRLRRRTLYATFLLFAGSLLVLATALNRVSMHYDGPMASEATLGHWEAQMQAQHQQIDRLRRESYYAVEDLVLRVRDLEVGLRNVESLGEHMLEEVGIKVDGFDMRRSKIGGTGGLPPSENPTLVVEAQEIYATLESARELEALLEIRGRQLQVLRSLVFGAHVEDARDRVSGWPVAEGWISSGYGRRRDPFTQQMAFHAGMDFGARFSHDIIATGMGVVTFVGRSRNYGNYVEIAHGQGLSTLYAHARSISVSPGDVVEKGQVIGEVGSTGRSTGTHVHYEVIQDGKRLNPWSFVQSTQLADASGR